MCLDRVFNALNNEGINFPVVVESEGSQIMIRVSFLATLSFTKCSSFARPELCIRIYSTSVITSEKRWRKMVLMRRRY